MKKLVLMLGVIGALSSAQFVHAQIEGYYPVGNSTAPISKAVGSQVIYTNGSDRISAVASLKEVTRIHSQDEPFLSVIDAVGDPKISVDYEILPGTGDIYVTVDGAKSGMSISAFGITATNTYNFTLTLKDVKAQQILVRNNEHLASLQVEKNKLTEKKEAKDKKAEDKVKSYVKINRSSSYKVELIDMIRALYYEAGIPGFKRKADKSNYGLHGNVFLNGRFKYVGDIYEAYVLTAHTSHGQLGVMDESIIEQFKPLAWTSSDDLIDSKKAMRVFVIKERSK